MCGDGTSYLVPEADSRSKHSKEFASFDHCGRGRTFPTVSSRNSETFLSRQTLKFLNVIMRQVRCLSPPHLTGFKT